MVKHRQYCFFFLFIFSFSFINTTAQGKFDYKAPGDILVQQKLKEWGRPKFGLMITRGTYSQWGIQAMPPGCSKLRINYPF